MAMDTPKKYPPFLVAIDKTRNRTFVMAKPNLCATKIDGEWYRTQPITETEIQENYDLVVDLEQAAKVVKEAQLSLTQREKGEELD